MAFVVKDAVREPLYAVVPYFNPWRWKSREKHTLRAIKHFADSGAVVILVEMAFNRREHALADCGLDGTPAECNVLGERKFKHRHLMLRTKDELWLKENSINVAVAQALPYDWQQVCWLDSDVHFLRPNWVGETIHKLQHYKYLQMFTHAVDLGPDYAMLPTGTPMANGTSFMHAQITGTLDQIIQGNKTSLTIKVATNPAPYPTSVWPGLAWAASREGWDGTGGLIDFAVWGGGDHAMAHALMEKSRRVTGGMHKNYRMLVNEWEGFCKRHIRKNVGVMTGTIAHNWHGRKTDRKYFAKHQLMQQVHFDPIHFLRKDYQGLYQLHDDGSDQFIHFRDMMRKIAKERNEDANEI
ncbi:MAG TPA: hypothetical protein VMU16_04285 [Candidatus Binataceae bacterium]|nr:hypothetical protein [Candidatus Binataceae bacterium]